jgi:hypothetical protein
MIGISSAINAVLKIIAVFRLQIDLKTVFYFTECS